MNKSSKRSFYRHFHNPLLRQKVGSLTAKVEVDFSTLEASVSFARCSQKDNFCRKTGRDIADKAKKIYFDYNPSAPAWMNIKAAADEVIKHMETAKIPPSNLFLQELKTIVSLMHVYHFHKSLGQLWARKP